MKATTQILALVVELWIRSYVHRIVELSVCNVSLPELVRSPATGDPTLEDTREEVPLAEYVIPTLVKDSQGVLVLHEEV